MSVNNIMLFDGAFGTYFARFNRGIRIPEMANLYDAETVLSIHREYIESGADAIKTNTFGANINLVSNRDEIRDIITKGFEIATKAAEGTHVKVFCDIGPINGETRREEYKDVADTFIKLGGKNFLFETQHEVLPLEQAIRHIRDNVRDSVIIVSFAVTQDGFTKSGGYYKNLMQTATDFGADYVGLNCICGPTHMASLIKQPDMSKFNIIAMPNAGYPQNFSGSPEYFATKLCELVKSGAEIVGGCCGTRPQDIAAAKKELSSFCGEKLLGTQTQKKQTQKNDALGTDGVMVAVELSPPMDTDTTYIIDAAKRAKEAGADVITIPDSPMGSARADSFHMASIIKREAGIRTVPHICCRDRNRVSMKGGLIAANIEGIYDVLAVTGDKMTENEREDAKNVFNFNSYKLINYISTLNDEVFFKNPFNIYAALNVNVLNFDSEIDRARRKLEEGATAFFTQPLFSQHNIDNYLKAKKTLKCRIFAGIMPPASYKNALFLNNEVPGIEIPAELVESLKDKPYDEVRKICVSYACGIIDSIKENCDGYYIMTPMKKIDYSLDIIKYIREKNVR